MSMSSVCGAESTVVHALLGRPILGPGALLCAAAVGGVLQMTGVPDQFGGCGEVGGDLYRVIESSPSTTLAYCVVPEEPAVAVSK
jgi:hypothetical protein